MVEESIPLSRGIYEGCLVLCCLAVGYALLSLIFSYTSGWQELRRVHGVKDVNVTKTWSFQWAYFDNGYGSLGRYRNSLKFGYAADGVYLSGMIPFIWFHRPILIPWKDAVVTWTDDFTLYSLSVTTVSITIPKKVYDGLIASKLVENTNSLLST